MFEIQTSIKVFLGVFSTALTRKIAAESRVLVGKAWAVALINSRL